MTSKEWKKVKLSTLCKIKGGKRLPKGSNLVTHKTKHPYIRVRDLANIKNLELSSSFEYIEDNVYNKIKNYTVNTGDVIISIVGTIGLVSIIDKSLNHANLTENCAKLINLQNIDNNFLYYFLSSELGQNEIKKGVVGAVQQKLPLYSIGEINVSLPPIETQEKIARVLSSLDDKIELNNKINQNLEQQAQAIFKSWFVDFEPFGGKMPEDWRIGTLGEYIEIKRGGSPRPIQNFITDKGYKWLKISDVTSLQTPFIYDIKESIKESGLNKTVSLSAGTLVLSNSATPGIPKILGIDSCIHDGWLYFPESKFSNEYLYLLFKSIRKNLVSLGNGSVFTNLKTDILRNYQVVLPSEPVLKNFDSIVKPIFYNIQNNTLENINLTQLRDTLLPKLMSGEIDVDKI